MNAAHEDDHTHEVKCAALLQQRALRNAEVLPLLKLPNQLALAVQALWQATILSWRLQLTQGGQRRGLLSRCSVQELPPGAAVGRQR